MAIADYNLHPPFVTTQCDPTHFQTTPSRVVPPDVGNHWTLSAHTLYNLCFNYCLFFSPFNLAYSFQALSCWSTSIFLTCFCLHLVGPYSNFKIQFCVFQTPCFFGVFSDFPRKNLTLLPLRTHT